MSFIDQLAHEVGLLLLLFAGLFGLFLAVGAVVK